MRRADVRFPYAPEYLCPVGSAKCEMWARCMTAYQLAISCIIKLSKGRREKDIESEILEILACSDAQMTISPHVTPSPDRTKLNQYVLEYMYLGLRLQNRSIHIKTTRLIIPAFFNHVHHCN